MLHLIFTGKASAMSLKPAKATHRPGQTYRLENNAQVLKDNARGGGSAEA